jgi:pimeloyl-ACP methyl ester carboxylesterase
MADRLLTSIPHALLVTIPGAYHHLTLDRPVEFTAALSTFLATR